MLLWRATSWWNQCCYVFCWIISRYIFGELSTLFNEISRVFCSCIIPLLMGLWNNVTCLNGHHRPQRTWWPSAPKYGQFKITDDVGAPCPHPRLCKKSVKQEAWIKSKPWTNYFHFTGGAWRGSFFRTPRELKCHNFHQNTLFESSNSKWWWRFTVCCSRQVRFPTPEKPDLRKGSVLFLFWRASVRCFLSRLRLRINTGFPVCTVINNKQQKQSVEVVSTIVCQCFFRSPQICTSHAHHRCTDRSHTFGYLCDKVLEMRSITNFILQTIRYPSLKEQLPNLQHLNIISSSVAPSLFFSFCACCPVRFDLVEKSVGWAWCLNDYR